MAASKKAKKNTLVPHSEKIKRGLLVRDHAEALKEVLEEHAPQPHKPDEIYADKNDMAAFRDFGQGRTLNDIADKSDETVDVTWARIKRAIAKMHSVGSDIHEHIRWQQYLTLTKIVNESMDAWTASQSTGAQTIVRNTTEVGDSKNSGRMITTGRNTNTRVVKGSGDTRYLETAMRALKEIRELYGVGADAEARLKAAERGGGEGMSMAAMITQGGVVIKTSWGTPVELGRTNPDDLAKNTKPAVEATAKSAEPAESA